MFQTISLFTLLLYYFIRLFHLGYRDRLHFYSIPNYPIAIYSLPYTLNHYRRTWLREYLLYNKHTNPQLRDIASWGLGAF